MFTSDQHILQPTYQCTSVEKNSHALLKNENAKNFVQRRGLLVK